MRVLIAPDSFKESLSAAAVARAIEAGFRDVLPDWEYVLAPVADGGEGTAEVLVAATGGRLVHRRVSGPLGEPVEAVLGLTNDGDTAIIEMAAASGLTLLAPSLRNPMRATTFGVGELILAALDLGARNFVIGLGGSATNDGGAGMAQALGVGLFDCEGREIARGGSGLASLDRIDVSTIDGRLAQCVFNVACDVNNPLLGPFGASKTFGQQKGATAEMVLQLEEGLQRYARCIQASSNITIDDMPAGGAAGGLAAGLLAFLGAKLRPGAEVIMGAMGLQKLVAEADLIVTGEGRIDDQSLQGKAPVAVARLARQQDKPVIAIAGSLGRDAHLVHDSGISAMFSVVSKPCTLEEALDTSKDNIRRTAYNVAATLRAALGIAYMTS